MKELIGSKFGEGVGGTVQTVANANNPSFDPASRETSTEKRIRALLAESVKSQLAGWEIGFLIRVYGGERLSRKAHITVGKIYARVFGGEA